MIDSESNARTTLTGYTNASGAKTKDWELNGIRGVFIERTLKFCECTNIPIYRHQLCQREMWRSYG